MGVFYLESPAMRLLQQKAGTGDFEHAVIHSSIIRPAANRFIREYLRRLHGEPFEPLHPSIKDILAENYGILVYQEDVVQTAMAMAGFSWGEADSLRKVISKKSRDQLADYRERFAQGCARNGISTEVVENVWDMFTSFSGYSFCKPHSASYALVSFKSAYLKAHHPAEFMAAVLSNGGGYYSTFAYISEARRMGIEVLGPDINESRLPYTGRAKTIRTGFQQLQAIRRSTIEAILQERSRGGPFSSVEDFSERVKMQGGLPISAAEAAILAKSGALDSICGPLNRPQILWFIEARLNRFHEPNNTQPVQRLQKNRQQIAAFCSRAALIKVPSLQDFPESRKWAHESQTLGFLLSAHPLESAGSFFRSLRQTIVSASDMSAHVGRKIHMQGWPVTRKEVLTREGEEMEFFTFEDKTGIFETVFFPSPFRRFCQDLDMSHAYLLHGLVESEFNVASLNVDYAYRVPM